MLSKCLKSDANESCTCSCHDKGKVTMGKERLRKKEEKILELGLEKWMQFG
jgi:hypothetical protein